MSHGSRNSRPYVAKVREISSLLYTAYGGQGATPVPVYSIDSSWTVRRKREARFSSSGILQGYELTARFTHASKIEKKIDDGAPELAGRANARLAALMRREAELLVGVACFWEAGPSNSWANIAAFPVTAALFGTIDFG